MDSTWKELFARLGPIRDIGRVPSGSPAVFVLRLTPGGPPPRTIDAIHALARRGMTMLRAKRAIEAMLDEGGVLVDVPVVEDPAALAGDLAAAGMTAALIEAPGTVDVRGLRERLQLSREQFASRYGFEVETLRNWETGRQALDATARSHLRAISNDPECVERAYAPAPSLTP